MTHVLKSIVLLNTMVFAVSVLMMAGCDKATKPQITDAVLPPTSESTEGTSESGSTQTATSDISDEEAAAFAEAWRQSVVEADLETAEKLISWRSIGERAIGSFDLSASDKSAFMKGTNQIAGNLSKVLTANLEGGGSYELIRIADRGGFKHAVFRLLNADSAMNYHDFRIVRINGKVCADHFFVAATGEDMADTLRKSLAPAIASNSSMMGRLSGEAKRNFDDLEKQNKMSVAMQAGRSEEVLAIYKQLPAELKKKKIPLLYRVMATNAENEAEYLAAIDDYIKYFPNDASIGLVTLDAAVIRNDADLLMKSREQLASWTGGDQYIDLLVGGVLSNMGDVEKAIEITRDIDPADVGIAAAHDFKLTVALAAEDHAEVLKRLRTLRDEFAYEFSDLRLAEGFEGFAASPEFKEWVADK